MIDETKYERELKSEIDPKADNPNYSLEYRQFLKEQTNSSQKFYAKLCKFAEKIIPAHITPEDEKKVDSYLQLLHISITPQSTRSLAYLGTVFALLLALLLTVMFVSIYTLVFGLVIVGATFYVLYKAPDLMFKMWRARASDQLISAVLYMVIYLEHTSNLEQAVYFAAKNLPPPLSLDFIRILWLVESGKYSNISDSLEDYSKVWQDHNPGFVESIHLIQSSLYVSTDAHRHEVLERTINTILESTEHNMMKYARETQNPVQAVHMLGIILPVMGLVMLPMVVSFMGDVVKIWHIILLYNIALPSIVYLLARNTINNRPSGVSTSDIYDFYADKNYKATVKIGNKNLRVSPTLMGIAVAAVFIIPSILYFANLYSDPNILLTTENTLTTLLFSLLSIVGLGYGFGTYYKLRVKDLVKQQNDLNKLDEEFANSVFQLGNRLEEGIPVEKAFKKVAETMPHSPVSVLFTNIYNNLVTNRMNLKQAIFDSKIGAVSRINSSLIRGVMRIIVEGSQKGSKIVSYSLITISRFLNSIKNVNERLKDLLAETIASLESEVKIFIPLIIGIVVSMAVLTTNILVSLSAQIGELGNLGSGEDSLSFGTTLLDIFKVDYLIPSWIFQLVVGVYLIQVTILMSYLLSGIVHGAQKVERGNTIQKNLFISTTIYFIVALAMSTMFMLITKGMGSGV